MLRCVPRVLAVLIAVVLAFGAIASAQNDADPRAFAPGPPKPVPSPVTLNAYNALVKANQVVLSGTTIGAVSVEAAGPSGVVTAPVVNGQFTITAPLLPDRLNRVFVTGIASNGLRGAPATANVTRDNQPPELHVDFPSDGELIQTQFSPADPRIDVGGRVADLLSGYRFLAVSINGQPAEVDVGIGTNGTFFLPDVPIQRDATTVIAVNARDALGNAVATQISVTHATLPPADNQMARISGNAQTGPVNQVLPQPLIARVFRKNPAGQGILPFFGKQVTFEVARSDGTLSTSPTGPWTQSVQVESDSFGDARVYWKLGGDAGCGNQRVRARSLGILGTVGFCASASPAGALQLNIGTGNNQMAEVGATLPEPLRAWVSDGCNGVGGVPVTFTVTEGNGRILDQTVFTTFTTQTGHAFANFEVGSVGNNRIEVNFPGNPNDPAVFVATGVSRDQPSTSFVGIVLNNAELPIEGAEVWLTIPNYASAPVLTDCNGVFRIENLPSGGPGFLHVEGATAYHVGGCNGAGVNVLAGSFPALHFEVVVTPQTRNSLPRPALLPPLNPANARSYSTTQDTVLTVEEITGLQMVIKAGSMTLPNGLPAPDGTLVSLNKVNHDKVPMPMPDGAAPPFAWTLQPGGSTFNPPIQITYPNMSGLPPGAITNFLSYNHDTERFEIVASGAVDSQGFSITTDPGSGLSLAGWGCNCPPYSISSSCRKCPDPRIDPCAIPSTDPNCPAGPGVCGTATTTCTCDDKNLKTMNDRCDGNGGCKGDPVVCGPGEDAWLAQQGFVTRYRALAIAAESIYTAQFYAGLLGFSERQQNAFRHLFWQCRTRWSLGFDVARGFGDAHEVSYCDSIDTLTDLHNNNIGRQLGANLLVLCDLAALNAMSSGVAIVDPPAGVFPTVGIPPAVGCPNPLTAGAGQTASATASGEGLSVSPPIVFGYVGDVIQLSVTAIDPGGAVVDLTSTASGTTYIPLEPSRLNFDASGLMTALAPVADRLLVTCPAPWDTTGQTYLWAIVAVTIGTPGDADGDGIPDITENAQGHNALDFADVDYDLDNDGLVAGLEYQLGTRLDSADSDGDSRTDGDEILRFGSDPLVPNIASGDWLVSVNGQVAQTLPNGAIAIENISLEDRLPVDFIGDDCVQLRAVRLSESGVATYAWSDPFRLRQGQPFIVPNYYVSNAPAFDLPESIRLALAPNIVSVAAPPQLVEVEATFATGAGYTNVGLNLSAAYPLCSNLPSGATVALQTSNGAIATISPAGLVNGVSPGRAYLTAQFQGAIAVEEVFVAPAGDPLTTIRGFVQLEDGTPVSGATIKVTQGANTLTTLSQSIGGQLGRFEIPGALSIAQPIQQGQAAKIQALVEVTVAGQPLRGISPLVDAAPGAVTDMGVIVVSAGGGGFRDYALTVPRNWVGSTALSLQINSRDYSVVQVRAPGIGFQQQIVTQPNGLYEVQLPLSLELTGSEIVESKGITVSATKDVHVSLVNRRPTTSEVFTALPTASLGFSYRVMSHRPADGSSTFAVLAIEDNTQVQITTTAATPNHPAGAMFLVDLNAYDAYQVQSSLGDLTGSIVTASKPIAVFGANRCARVPDTQDFCDYLVEQLPPTPAWGTQFSAVPLSGRLNGDTWRLLASELDTTITIDGPGAAQQQLHLTNAGDFVQLNLPGFQTISSNKPILAAQFANGTAFDNQPGDPMMMLVAANNQWLSSYVFSTPTAGFNSHYVNIVAPLALAQAGQVLLDGVSVPSGAFTTLPGGQFAAARRTLTAGKHRLSAPAPLGAQVYGFAGAPNHEGYGFPAALSLPIGH